LSWHVVLMTILVLQDHLDHICRPSQLVTPLLTIFHSRSETYRRSSALHCLCRPT
jgi:hypothetical protein